MYACILNLLRIPSHTKGMEKLLGANHRCGIEQTKQTLTNLLLNVQSLIGGRPWDDPRVAEACPQQGGHHEYEDESVGQRDGRTERVGQVGAARASTTSLNICARAVGGGLNPQLTTSPPPPPFLSASSLFNPALLFNSCHPSHFHA